MEVSEKQTPTSASGLAAAEEAEQGNDDLWVRLEREQLSRDPRANRYGRIWADSLDATEPIIELLDTLRERTPPEPVTGRAGLSLLARLLNEPTNAEEEETSTPRRWQLAARVRVRARNLLRRWADAQADPRLAWVEPLAPAGNFATIVGAFAELNLAAARGSSRLELTEIDLNGLWLRWLGGFAGGGTRPGWLNLVDQETRASARHRLPRWMPEAAAALCWLTVRHGPGHRERVVEAQPVIIAAFDHDLLDPTDETARYVNAITRSSVTRAEIEQDLLDAVCFVDDELWCLRTAAELGVDSITLEAPPGAATIQVRVNVEGVTEPLLDSRLPRLLTSIRRYRRCRGVALYATDGSWRLSLADGETIVVLPGVGQEVVQSREPVNDHVLDVINGATGVLADLFA